MVLMGILNESCVEISLQKDGNENTSETLNSWNKIWCSAVIVQHKYINMLLNQGNPYSLKITFRNKNGRRQSLLHQFTLLVLLLPRLPELLFVKWLRYRRLRGPAALPKSFHTVIRVFFSTVKLASSDNRLAKQPFEARDWMFIHSFLNKSAARAASQTHSHAFAFKVVLSISRKCTCTKRREEKAAKEMSVVRHLQLQRRPINTLVDYLSMEFWIIVKNV